MHELRMVYKEIGDDIAHFLELYRLSKDAHMDAQQIINLLQIANNDLPTLEFKYKRLIKEINLLELEKQKSKNLGNQIRTSTKVLDEYKEEIKNLQKKKIRLEILISSGQYEKVRQIVEEVTNSLSKRKDLLKLAISSVIESIIRNPDKYSFLVSSSVYNGGQHAASQSYIDVYRTLILDDAEKLLEIMVQDLTSNIINQAAWTVHPQTT